MRRRREWITFSNRHRIGQWRKSPALPSEYGQSGMNEREAPRIPGSPEKALFLSLATPIGNALVPAKPLPLSKPLFHSTVREYSSSSRRIAKDGKRPATGALRLDEEGLLGR